VAFLCQQSAEKILKALWCARREDPPPYTHNLATLVESLQLDVDASMRSLMDRLTKYYIVGRYPTFKQKLASSLRKKDAKSILTKTAEFVRWCKKYIPT
jgi:HEPN domain-containing protein